MSETKTDPLLVELADTLSELEHHAGIVVLTCERAETLIAARLSAPLPARGRDALEAHLAGCDSCLELARAAEGAAVSEALLDLGGVPEEDLAALPSVASDLYVRGHEVGRGGMGRIVRARDRRLGRAVAIKELLDDRLSERFEREARLTARLQHPGIVGVLEAGRWEDGAPFYAMKYVAGRPLSEALAEEPTLAGRLQYLPNLIAAVDAIAYAHAERVIHRDLKPANILIGPFGETVVVDWGLAKDLTEDASDAPLSPYRDGGEGLTRAGAGTPRYMPPEQARGDDPDERTDVYALGATLYHLLAGKAPDEPISMACPEAPLELVAIVVKAMDPELEHRYADAAALAAELKRFQTGQLVEAHRYTLGELLRRFLRRHRGPVAVAAAALVVVASGGAIGVSRILSARADAIAQRDRSLRTEGTLLVELARQELLAGKVDAAREKLERALAAGERGPVARFLRAQADRQAWRVIFDRDFTSRGRLQNTLTADGRIVGTDQGAVHWVEAGGSHDFDLGEGTPEIAPDGQLGISTVTGLSFGDVWLVPPRALVFDTRDGHTVAVLDGLPEGATFSSSGRHVIGWEADDLVVWERTGRPLARLPRGGVELAAADVSVDGRIVAWVGADGGVHVSDLATGGERARAALPRPPRLGFGVVSSASGHRLALVYDKEIVLFDSEAGVVRGTYATGMTFLPARRTVAFSADGSRLLTPVNAPDACGALLDQDGRLVTLLRDEDQRLVSLHFARDGRVVGLNADRVMLWSATGRRLGFFVYPFAPLGAAVDVEGTSFALVGKHRTVVYEIPATAQGKVLVPAVARAGAFSERGELAVVDATGTISIFAADGRLRFTAKAARPWTDTFGRTVVGWGEGVVYAMGLDSAMAVVDLATGTRQDYAGLRGWSEPQLFPTARGLVVAGRDPEGARRFELWHIDGGRRGLLPPGLDVDRIHFVAADGLTAYVETRDGLVWRLGLRNGRTLPLFRRHPIPRGRWRESLDVTADGRLLIHATDEGTFVWDGARPQLMAVEPADAEVEGFATGAPNIHTFRPSKEAIRWSLDAGGRPVRGELADVANVRMRPDGQLYAATYRDGSLRLYAGSAELAQLTFGDEQGARVLGWSPDGRQLLVATARDTRLVDLSSR